MPLPAPLQTLTVRGSWPNPVGGDPLAGTAQLRAVRHVQSAAGDVILTTEPVVKTLSAGAAEWTGVLATDSTGLDREVVYELQVQGDDGYFHRRLVELRLTQAVGGVIQLADVADAVLGPAVSTYLLASNVGQVGGTPGPLDATGKVPAAQIPAGGATPDATTTSKGIVQLAGDLAGTAAAPTVPGKQPLDSDLTAIAGLSPANDDVIQRKAGAWTNRTPAQVKVDLVLVKGDVGLGNVDNTSDAAKPISTATQTALDGKVDESVLDAKGDLYVASAADTPARLAVGANGQIPLADNSQTVGIRWAARTTPAYDPAMDGLVAVAGDPAIFRSQAALGAAGWAVRVPIPAGRPITGALACLQIAGTVGAGGVNGYAINDDTGALVASTVDDNNLWAATGMRAKAFASQIAAQTVDRYLYVSLRVSGYTGAPQFAFVDGSDTAGRLDGLQGGKRRSLVLSGSTWGSIDPVAGATGSGYMPLIALY